MKRLTLLALVLASCATIQPGELAKVESDLQLVTADVTALALDAAPEFVLLKQAVKDKEWLKAFEQALLLADRVQSQSGPLQDHLKTLRADLKALTQK